MHPQIHAGSSPDKAAIVMASNGRRVSYRELDSRSNQLAHLLRSRSLKCGDHIAILLENHVCYLEICWAAQRSGLIFTPISTHLTAAEASFIVNDCGAKALITSKAQEFCAAALLDLACTPPVRLMFDGIVDGYEPYEAAVAQMPTHPIADQTAGAEMPYSSGTTGQPRGVLAPPTGKRYDEPSVLTQVATTLFGFDNTVTYLSPAPAYHSAPLRFNMAVQQIGGTCVIMDRFDAETMLRSIQEHRITHVQLVPTMFVRLLRLPAQIRSAYDLRSLKWVVHAAAPCPIPVKKQMIEWWGPIIWEFYGGTEGNGMTMIDTSDWLCRPGSVGRAAVGRIHVCDDTGNEVPTGTTGTIYFENGPTFEYHNDATKTHKSRHRKGWSTMGDVGYVDSEEYLYLTDRKFNMIISGGVNIYPQEAENLLLTHPKVADAAVFGVPNEEFGEEVKGVVQLCDATLAGPEMAQELIAFCRQHLSPIKCPRTIDFQPALPRQPNGKLLKRLLRDQYWAGHASKLI